MISISSVLIDISRKTYISSICPICWHIVGSSYYLTVLYVSVVLVSSPFFFTRIVKSLSLKIHELIIFIVFVGLILLICALLIISFHLLTLNLFYSPFSSSLQNKVILFAIFFLPLMEVFITINFPLKSTFTASYKF